MLSASAVLDAGAAAGCFGAVSGDSVNKQKDIATQKNNSKP